MNAHDVISVIPTRTKIANVIFYIIINTNNRFELSYRYLIDGLQKRAITFNPFNTIIGSIRRIRTMLARVWYSDRRRHMFLPRHQSANNNTNIIILIFISFS